MAVINKITLENGGVTTTYNIKDEISGYGSFSANQVMSGATTSRVATIKYQAMSTTTQQFGATTTVYFYSTSGSSSGNEWGASVDDMNLILRRSWIMPDFSTRKDVATILENLTSAKILTKSGNNYSPAGNFNVNIVYYETSGSKPKTLSITPTTPRTAPSSLARTSTQSPAAGTVIYGDRTEAITITQNQNG